jgi:5-methylcytosine-specific restriction endonuclease McrA
MIIKERVAHPNPKLRSQIPVYYSTPHWRRLRTFVLQRDEGVCFYCGGMAITADHVTPRGWGGADHPNNLVACCATCNEVAGGKNFKKRGAKKAWIAKERRKIEKGSGFNR